MKIDKTDTNTKFTLTNLYYNDSYLKYQRLIIGTSIETTGLNTQTH